MNIAGEDGGAIRPEPSAQKTRGDQAELARWALSLPEEQRDRPLLSVRDVVAMIKAAKECVAEGVKDTVPVGVPLHTRPLLIKGMNSVGQGACDFLGYGLVEACRMRLEGDKEVPGG